MIFWVFLCCSSKSVDSGSIELSGCETSFTYTNFGQGFISTHCQGCHASTAPNRYGAPESVVFDTEADVMAWKERILERSTGDNPDMPPAGGIEQSELDALEEWLSCPH